MYAEIKKEDKILINRLDNNEKILLKSIVDNSSNKTIALQELYSDDGEFGGCFVNLTESKEKEELKEMNLLGTLDDFTIQKGNVAVIQFITDVPDNDIDVYIRWTGKQALLDSSTISLYPERTGTFSYCILAEGYKPYLGDFTITVEEQPVDNKGTVRLKIYAGPDNDITEANEVAVTCTDVTTGTDIEVVRVIDSEGYYTFQVPDYTHPYTIKVSYPNYQTYTMGIEFEGETIYTTTVTLTAEIIYPNPDVYISLYDADTTESIDVSNIPVSHFYLQNPNDMGTIYNPNQIIDNNILYFQGIPANNIYEYNLFVNDIPGYPDSQSSIPIYGNNDQERQSIYLSGRQIYDTSVVYVHLRSRPNDEPIDLSGLDLSNTLYLFDNQTQNSYFGTGTDSDLTEGIIIFDNIPTNKIYKIYSLYAFNIPGYSDGWQEIPVSPEYSSQDITVYLSPEEQHYDNFKLNISIFDENNMPITIDQNIHNIQLSHEGGEYYTPDIVDNNVITYNSIPTSVYYTFRLTNVEGYKDFDNTFFAGVEMAEESLSFNLEPVGPVNFILDLKDRDSEPIYVSDILTTEGLESLEDLSNYLKVVNINTDEQYYPTSAYNYEIFYDIPANTTIRITIEGLQYYSMDDYIDYRVTEYSNLCTIRLTRNEETKYDYGTIRVRLGNESGEELSPSDVSDSLPDKIKLYADYGDEYGDEYPMDTDSIGMGNILFRNIPTDTGYVLHYISPITINGISYNFPEEDMHIRKRVLSEEDRVYITLTRIEPEPQIDIQIGHTYRFTAKENVNPTGITLSNETINLSLDNIGEEYPNATSAYIVIKGNANNRAELVYEIDTYQEEDESTYPIVAYTYIYEGSSDASTAQEEGYWDGPGWYDYYNMNKSTPLPLSSNIISIKSDDNINLSEDAMTILLNYFDVEDITE